MARTGPLTPLPNADQLAPFQRAMRLALAPAAVVNSPPAYTSVPLTAMARTLEFRPPASADQLLPFQRAMWLAATAPALVKLPPT